MNEEHALISQEGYDPNRLLNALLEKMNLKNDAALSRMLEVAPPVISKIRHRRLPIGASMLIRMHEATDMSIRELRDLMGDRRQKYRVSDAYGKPQPVEKSETGNSDTEGMPS
jgi:plasmid maintenance system antidote protein VapI